MSDTTIETILTMTEEVKAGSDTTATLLGVPVIRCASFTRDFKDLVRRLVDAGHTTTSNRSWLTDTERDEDGHPPSRRREGAEWKEEDWKRDWEKVVVSVAGRVKGLKTLYSKVIHGWENDDGDWVSSAEMGDWDGSRGYNNYSPKTQRRSVMEYLPDDDRLRITLFNLFSAPKTDDHYAEMLLDSKIPPFENNAG